MGSREGSTKNMVAGSGVVDLMNRCRGNSSSSDDISSKEKSLNPYSSRNPMS